MIHTYITFTFDFYTAVLVRGLSVRFDVRLAVAVTRETPDCITTAVQAPENLSSFDSTYMYDVFVVCTAELKC